MGLQVTLQKESYRENNISRRDTIKFWNSFFKIPNLIMFKTINPTSQIFYVSQNKNREVGHHLAQCVSNLAELLEVKSNWSSDDVIKFRRGEFYADNGEIDQLKNAGVFIEAFGAGDPPVIKNGSLYTEIKSSAWF